MGGGSGGGQPMHVVHKQVNQIQPIQFTYYKIEY